MAQVLIRNLDDDLVETYRQKAKIKGLSLEQELRNLLEANRPFTPDERVAASRAVRAMQKGIAEPMTLDEIRQGRGVSEPLVVDASVALKWFVVENESAAAERLLAWHEDLHAPDLLLIEVANGLRNNVRKRAIEPEQALAGFATMPRAIDRWHETARFLPEAFRQAMTLDHPVYDLCYLGLARSIGMRLVTADDRFIRKLQGGPEARHLIHLRDLP